MNSKTWKPTLSYSYSFYFSINFSVSFIFTVGSGKVKNIYSTEKTETNKLEEKHGLALCKVSNMILKQNKFDQNVSDQI